MTTCEQSVWWWLVTDSQIQSIEGALIARLEGDAELAELAPGGVWNTLADRAAEYPVIVVRKRTGTRYVTTLGDARASRVMGYDVYAIEAHVAGTAAARIDERIHELLSDHRLSVEPYACLYCRRFTDIDLVEVDDGVEYQYRGGAYEIWMQ